MRRFLKQATTTPFNILLNSSFTVLLSFVAKQLKKVVKATVIPTVQGSSALTLLSRLPQVLAIPTEGFAVLIRPSNSHDNFYSSTHHP